MNPAFLSTKNGWINLANVREIKCHPENKRLVFMFSNEQTASVNYTEEAEFESAVEIIEKFLAENL